MPGPVTSEPSNPERVGLEQPPPMLAEHVGPRWTADGPGRWVTPTHHVYSCDDDAGANHTLDTARSLDPSRWTTLRSIGRWVIQPRPDGLSAHQPERHGEIGGLAELAGQELRRLHSQEVPAEATNGWEQLAASVAGSPVDPATLDEPFCRYDLARLSELWRESRPGSDDLVVCHGQPRLEHLIVSSGVVTGWIEPRHLTVADRHLDLAVAHRSIHANLGADAVFRFYDAYGDDPSLLALEHYMLADLLIP